MKPFPEAHPKLRQVVVDLTDSHATRRVGEEIVRTQQVTTLIHNAGTIRSALLPQVKLEDLEALVNLHLSAALLLLQATFAQAIPVKRLGQADDVARAVLFFADRDKGFVTGQVLYVCGGTSVGSLVV
jgi:NAD(P)-dependent dehydrogenase (short-subunit alcohol dehydrogenase family)